MSIAKFTGPMAGSTGRRVALFLLLGLFVLSMPGPAEAGVNRWTTNGPTGTPILAVAIDPSTSTTIYAAAFFTGDVSKSGVFRSTDGGASWKPTGLTGLAGGLTGFAAQHVTVLAIDPSTPTTLYAGTAHLGIFKSTDGGDSWNPTGLTGASLTGAIVGALAIDPSTTPTTIYAGSRASDPSVNGVFKSTDGGDSWNPTGLAGVPVNAVMIDPSTPTTLYAGTQNAGSLECLDFAFATNAGVFKSSNGGDTWTQLTDPTITGVPVCALAIDSSTRPTTIYAGSPDVIRGGVFKSTDEGHSWTAVLTNALVSALAIDPSTPTTIYAGTKEFGDFFKSGVLRSPDGGNNWKPMNIGLATCAVPALAINRSTPTMLYAGTSGGRVGVFQIALNFGAVPDFDWKLERRTSLDCNGKLQIPSVRVDGTRDFWWGSVDVPAPTEIAPAAFNVTLEAAIAPGDSPVASWQIQTLNDGSIIANGNGNPFQSALPRGAYQVTLTVQGANGAMAPITRTVTVKDLLIVAMGDSMTSGEGNPNVPQLWEHHDFLLFDELKAGPIWEDTRDDGPRPGRYSRCHRSKFAWPVLVADEIERRDPHISVTLLHLGCSGAEITGDGGILKPYVGTEGVPGVDPTPPMEPQLRQVLRALCPGLPDLPSPSTDPIGDCPDPSLMRQIDALMMTIGVNDIHFSEIIADCIETTLFPFGGDCSDDGTPGQFGSRLAELGINHFGASTTPTRYQQLDDALTRHLPDLARARVYISQYPDPLHDANSNLCTEGWHPDSPLDYGGFFPSPRAGDIEVLSALTLRENVWLDTTALLELNDTIEFNASSGFGWNTVIGIADLTRNHGVCAGQARWFRQGIESLVLQGPAHSLPVGIPLIAAIDSVALLEVLLGEKSTKGLIHPNHAGHRAIADLFLTSLAGTGVLPAPDTTPPTISAPPNVLVETGPGATLCSAVVSDATLGSATASDDSGITTINRSGVPAGNIFPVGATALTYTATDFVGLTSSATQTVTVNDTTPPVLSTPANVTVNATSPAGAVVTYPPPAATDNCAGVSVTSAPPSGSTFAIGTTTVTVTATDAAGNPSSTIFLVTVVGAAGRTTALSALVSSFGLDHGIENSLLTKLENVLAAIGASNVGTACSSLSSFINEVQAQTGKKITAAQAAQLIAAANQIKAVLGCL